VQGAPMKVDEAPPKRHSGVLGRIARK
jgi:hypothetical protein